MFNVRGLFTEVQGHGAFNGFFYNLAAAFSNEEAWDLLRGTVGYVFALILLRQLYFHFHLDERKWGRINNPKTLHILEPIAYALIILACAYFRGESEAFIYFQF